MVGPTAFPDPGGLGHGRQRPVPEDDHEDHRKRGGPGRPAGRAALGSPAGPDDPCDGAPAGEQRRHGDQTPGASVTLNIATMIASAAGSSRRWRSRSPPASRPPAPLERDERLGRSPLLKGSQAARTPPRGPDGHPVVGELRPRRRQHAAAQDRQVAILSIASGGQPASTPGGADRGKVRQQRRVPVERRPGRAEEAA